jgi:hypothetical protein
MLNTKEIRDLIDLDDNQILLNECLIKEEGFQP